MRCNSNVHLFGRGGRNQVVLARQITNPDWAVVLQQNVSTEGGVEPMQVKRSAGLEPVATDPVPIAIVDLNGGSNLKEGEVDAAAPTWVCAETVSEVRTVRKNLRFLA